MIITISGDPGAGKSTVSRILADFFGFKYVGIGSLLRKLSRSRKQDLIIVSKYAEENFGIDKCLDYNLKKLAGKDNYVVDARLGFHFIPDSIKISLIINPLEAAKRIIKDPRSEEKASSLKALVAELKRRKKSEVIRYKKYYNINIASPSNFDLTLNTSNFSVDEVVSIILSFLIDKGVLNA